MFFALLIASTPLSAAQGFDAHGLHLAPQDTDVRGTLVVRQPEVYEQGEWRWGLIGEFGYGALVRARQTTASDPVERTLVMEGLTTTNLSTAYAPRPELLLDLHVPIHLLASGQERVEGPAALGDTRLTATWSGSADAAPAGTRIGTIAWIDLPTGAEERFLGQPGLGGGFGGQVGWANSALRVNGEIGMQFQPALDLDNLSGANTLVTGVSVGGYAAQKMGLIGEIRTSSPLSPSEVPGSIAHAELIGSARWGRSSGRVMVAGFSSALSSGAGLPAWRLFLGGAFGTKSESAVVRRSQAQPKNLCPDGSAPVLGRTVSDGCYVPLTVVARYQEKTMISEYVVRTQGGETRASSDANGWRTKGLPGDTWVVEATSDGCLEGAASLTVSEHGGWMDIALEPNRSATVTLNVENQKGEPLSGAQTTWTGGHPDCFAHGTQSALDGTLPVSIAPGEWTVTVRKAGHAPVTRTITVAEGEDEVLRVQLQSVPLWLETDRILLYEPIRFDAQTARLTDESSTVLNALADLLTSREDVLAIRIDAHTHDRGEEDDNLALSERRAKAVQDALIARGIRADRLEARGVGEAEPIAPNRTALGRARNERIELQVLETPGGAR